MAYSEPGTLNPGVCAGCDAQAECRKYEALALMQPALGMHLEGMCVSVLREVLDALLRACGVDSLLRTPRTLGPQAGKSGTVAPLTEKPPPPPPPPPFLLAMRS